MDLDADLKRLKAWKNEVAELLTPRVLTALLALAASEQDGDIGEHVTAVQKTVDGFDTRLKAVEGAQAPDLAEIVARLDVIDTKLVVLSDPAMVELLNWLAANREGLDVLLSLGDDAAGGGSVGTGNGGSGNGGSGGPTTTMGSAGGTGTAGGSSSGGGTSAGTDGAAAGQASQGAAAGEPAA